MSGEYRRVCRRCHQPIKQDEPSDVEWVFSPSGPGATVDLHLSCPKPPPPPQTFPARLT
ncbi:hypothetical protein ACIRO1_17230 [Streptomyces sp. NPDC102381]|uniref:hypothetical protein n=1 Tax=Streptomyces sp. NPDC102381 TaxID=3366164 RepID=UPI0038228850